MAVAYNKLIRQTALRINAVTGVTKAALETNYAVSPLTTTQVGTPDFPLKAIQDAVINSVGKLVRAYAFQSSHPFRNFNLSQTSGIAKGAVIPSTNSAGKPIVGVYGAIRDASDGKALTEQPVQLINDIADNTDSFLVGAHYYYKIVGERLFHTRTSAVIDVCTFDRATEEAAVAANGNAPIPDALEDAAWCGAVGLLVRDEEFLNQAAMHTNYFMQVMAEITQGASHFQPAPALINTAAPQVS
jgi:hypothetical protein